MKSIPNTPRGRMISNHLQGIIEIISEYGFSSPRLFGSVARGDDSTESDIDILVACPNKKSKKYRCS